MNSEQQIKLAKQEAGYLLINEWRNELQQKLTGFEFISTSEIVEYIFNNYHLTPREGDLNARYRAILDEVLINKGILPVEPVDIPNLNPIKNEKVQKKTLLQKEAKEQKTS